MPRNLVPGGSELYRASCASGGRENTMPQDELRRLELSSRIRGGLQATARMADRFQNVVVPITLAPSPFPSPSPSPHRLYNNDQKAIVLYKGTYYLLIPFFSTTAYCIYLAA